MITFREYEADKYRRQELMACAGHHRVLKSISHTNAKDPTCFRCMLGRIGDLLVALGQRMQIESVDFQSPISTG